MNSPAPSADQAITVGVFDSGVGGLSVLRALHGSMPGVRLVYVADSGYAPYGERSDEYVIARSRHITRFLQEQGARVIVIACNTATAAAIQVLRADNPGTVFVGVEPGLKPAMAMSRRKAIGVMATAGTLRSKKFQTLLRPFGDQGHIHLQACTGLAQSIEQGDLQSVRVQELIEQHCAPLREAGVDTVVLGCTHYPFVRDGIERALGPDVQLVDTAEAIARRAVSQLQALELTAEVDPPRVPVVAYTSGDLAMLERICGAWLDFSVEVRPLP